MNKVVDVFILVIHDDGPYFESRNTCLSRVSSPRVTVCTLGQDRLSGTHIQGCFGRSTFGAC